MSSRPESDARFGDAALLLGPADERIAFQSILAPADWTLDGPDVRAEVVVWGRGPAGWKEGVATRGWRALRRERALARLRSRGLGPVRVSGVHRWPPPAFGSRVEDWLRAGLMGGVLVELSRGPRHERIVDACLDAAGLERPRRPRPSSSGALLVRADHGGRAALLRAARLGSPGDPQRAIVALEALRAAGVTAVPTPLGFGRLHRAVWAVESWLGGARPTALTEDVIEAASRFAAALPASTGPPTAPLDDLDALATHLPGERHRLLRLRSGMEEAVGDLPALARHGDFRSGNLLVSRRRLTGVVDWDAWHPAGVPGADLLHLLGMDEAVRRGLGLGSMWVRRPWRSREHVAVLSSYWRELGLSGDRELLEVAAVAWWAAAVRNLLDRLPHLAVDTAWRRDNVEQVLEVASPTG